MQASATTEFEHRVAFYETDAMGIVHHANYLHIFERARVLWLEQHHRPYTDYMARGLHFAVTEARIEYSKPARFDDRLHVTTGLEWVRGASLCMHYTVRRNGAELVSGSTEHAAVDEAGRVRRIPRDDRAALRLLCRED